MNELIAKIKELPEAKNSTQKEKDHRLSGLLW